jgi:hypothetical protein
VDTEPGRPAVYEQAACDRGRRVSVCAQSLLAKDDRRGPE